MNITGIGKDEKILAKGHHSKLHHTIKALKLSLILSFCFGILFLILSFTLPQKIIIPSIIILEIIILISSFIYQKQAWKNTYILITDQRIIYLNKGIKRMFRLEAVEDILLYRNTWKHIYGPTLIIKSQAEKIIIHKIPQGSDLLNFINKILQLKKNGETQFPTFKKRIKGRY